MKRTSRTITAITLKHKSFFTSVLLGQPPSVSFSLLYEPHARATNSILLTILSSATTMMKQKKKSGVHKLYYSRWFLHALLPCLSYLVLKLRWWKKNFVKCLHIGRVDEFSHLFNFPVEESFAWQCWRVREWKKKSMCDDAINQWWNLDAK